MPKRHRALTAFGLAVRRAREAKGLTQEKLPERNASLLRLAKGLGMPLSELNRGIEA